MRQALSKAGRVAETLRIDWEGDVVTERVVVADIGGTHARFALADRALVLSGMRVYATADFASADDLVGAFLRESGAPVSALCLAVAGVVRDGHARLTNRTLVFDAEALGRRFASCRLVNDFVAASLGVPHVAESELVTIGAAAPGVGTKAVIGPGTGLGMGILVPGASGYRALPSEGGHGDLASTDPLEHEVYQLLAAEVGFVSWESVLSGPGLLNLYRAVCRLWEAAPRWTAPEEITREALEAADPVCHQTLEIFCNLLGSAAGNLALTVCADGGVYLCGGIVPHIVDALSASRFRRRFESRGPMSEYARGIATVVVRSRHLGLIGAAAAHWQAEGPHGA
jgi:glucokinase